MGLSFTPETPRRRHWNSLYWSYQRAPSSTFFLAGSRGTSRPPGLRQPTLASPREPGGSTTPAPVEVSLKTPNRFSYTKYWWLHVEAARRAARSSQPYCRVVRGPATAHSRPRPCHPPKAWGNHATSAVRAAADLQTIEQNARLGLVSFTPETPRRRHWNSLYWSYQRAPSSTFFLAGSRGTSRPPGLRQPTLASPREPGGSTTPAPVEVSLKTPNRFSYTKYWWLHVEAARRAARSSQPYCRVVRGLATAHP